MAQYDNCAADYVASKKEGFRVDVEYFTFLHRMLLPTLGKDILTNQYHDILAGKRILDLACGDGHYTRKLKEQLGAEEVVGIDISQGMIDIARAKEDAEPLGIIYQVADAQQLPPPIQKYDIVTAFYLLNFARTSDELKRMVEIIDEQLADKQSFFGVITNVCGEANTYNNDKHRKYSFIREANLENGQLSDGAEVKYTHFNTKDNSSFSYITYYLSKETYERVFKEVGFTNFKWIPMESCPTVEDRAFYDDFIQYAPAIGIIASKKSIDFSFFSIINKIFSFLFKSK
uniref:Putative methylase-like protein n=1 Tax=Adineta vaga TaxID=104782 RepID=B3G4M7_ADIVA|nr:putative methylase-like protein [Adineta vaga]